MSPLRWAYRSRLPLACVSPLPSLSLSLWPSELETLLRFESRWR